MTEPTANLTLTQSELLAATRATIRDTIIGARTFTLTTTDQHTGHGFVLCDVQTPIGALSEVDPPALEQLKDQLESYLLADLDWDDVVGEDEHGDVTLKVRP
jgi:hypothetical protein